MAFFTQNILGDSVQRRGQLLRRIIRDLDASRHIDDVVTHGVQGAQGLADGHQRIGLLHLYQLRVRTYLCVPSDIHRSVRSARSGIPGMQPPSRRRDV